MEQDRNKPNLEDIKFNIVTLSQDIKDHSARAHELSADLLNIERTHDNADLIDQYLFMVNRLASGTGRKSGLV